MRIWMAATGREETMGGWLCEDNIGLSSYTEKVKKAADGHWVVLRHMATESQEEQHFRITVLNSKSSMKSWMCLRELGRGLLSEGKSC